jgi:tricorn protease
MTRITVGVLLTAAAVAVAAPSELFRTPAVSRTQIVFHYAGDLWTVAREGGGARRLTSSAGEETSPAFSPDGRWIAFSGQYDGNTDVFVIPAEGGVPKRVTYHPAPDHVVGWAPDGKRVLFRSNRAFFEATRLFAAPVDGAGDGAAEELPFPLAHSGSYSPDGSRIAYLPLAPAFTQWKRYRGGRMSKIWLGSLADSSVEEIPRAGANDFNPMWVGGRIYFLSDRGGPFTLYSYDVKTKRVEQRVANSGFDLKSASACEDAIVYEQFGGIYLYDLNSGKPKQVPITVSNDLLEVRPRMQRITSVRNAAISPSGVRAVMEARGEIFTVPAEKGDIRNLTQTPGAAERDPAWSPDGRWIAYQSDASGEYELHLREQNGMGEPRKFRLSEPPSFYYGFRWSPDSKRISFTDKALHVAWLDVETGKVTRVDTDRYAGPRRAMAAEWSPDGRWLVYTKQEKSTLRRVYVHSVESGQSAAVTDGMSDAYSPVFDKDGKHLYFLASTNAGLTVGWRDMTSFDRPVTASAYLVVLRKDLPSPLAPESDEEKVAASGGEKKDAAGPAAKPEVRIDFEGIGQRILAIPAPARAYRSLMAGKAGVLFLEQGQETGQDGSVTVQKFDFKTRKLERFVEGVRGAEISANGEKMLLAHSGNRFAIVGTGAAPKAGDGALKLETMEARVDPRAEWRQMFDDAWRRQRDFFYDPGLHGVDIGAMKRRYEPFLANVGSREDLNHLFAEMMGEFSISHLYVTGGQKPPVAQVAVGLLGCDFEIAEGRYRFRRVYDGENWNPDLRAPLTQPGVNARAGEFLLAVNGLALTGTDNVYARFEGLADKQVTLRIGPAADGSGARDVTVTPVDSELRLRGRAWVEDNRRRVDQLSGGRLAYMHIPDTSRGGYTNFNRYYFAQVGKEGAIVDERFNHGGAQPDYIVDYLKRPLLHYRNTRHGEDFTGPMGAIFGPKAMLINEYAGSGGDTLPWYFRKQGVGPLVGKTTWGGLVGGLGGYPPLMDGGNVSVPSVGFWDPDTGEWVAENTGIKPDIDVDLDPKAWRQGKDSQLEKAVEALMAELNKPRKAQKPRPPFPNYHKQAAQPGSGR